MPASAEIFLVKGQVSMHATLCTFLCHPISIIINQVCQLLKSILYSTAGLRPFSFCVSLIQGVSREGEKT